MVKVFEVSRTGNSHYLLTLSSTELSNLKAAISGYNLLYIEMEGHNSSNPSQYFTAMVSLSTLDHVLSTSGVRLDLAFSKAGGNELSNYMSNSNGTVTINCYTRVWSQSDATATVKIYGIK